MSESGCTGRGNGYALNKISPGDFSVHAEIAVFAVHVPSLQVTKTVAEALALTDRSNITEKERTGVGAPLLVSAFHVHSRSEAHILNRIPSLKARPMTSYKVGFTPICVPSPVPDPTCAGALLSRFEIVR